MSAVGKLQKHKFENCMTIDRSSWGYRRNAAYGDYLTVSEIIVQLVETVRFVAFYDFTVNHCSCVMVSFSYSTFI